MKRVLVTGAGGFIGRHCVPLLQRRGFEVHAVSSRPRPGQEGVVWRCADLLRPGALSALLDQVSPSHVLHLAWVARPGIYSNSPENIAWLRASLELIPVLAASGGLRVVAAGTCMDDAAPGRTTTVQWPSLYGAAKTAFYKLLQAGTATAENADWAWARIFFFFGPWEPEQRLVPQVIRALLKGEPVRCSSGEQIRDYLYVTDLAEALVALLDSNLRGPVDIGSGHGYSVAELACTLGRQLGCAALIQLGALPAAAEPCHLVADVARLRAELGWQPQVSLEEGLERTISWWRSQLAPAAGG